MEYAGYCSHLCSVVQFVHCEQRGIEEDWIVEAKNKLSRRIGEEEIRESSELQGKMVRSAEVKRKMLVAKDAPITDEVNDEDFF